MGVDSGGHVESRPLPADSRRRRPGFGSESRSPDRRPRRWQNHSRCRPRPARGADFHRRGGPTGPPPSGTHTFSPRSHPPHGDSSPFSRSLERTGGARVQAFCRVPLRLAEGDRHTEQSRAVSPGIDAVSPAAAGFGCLVQSRRTCGSGDCWPIRSIWVLSRKSVPMSWVGWWRTVRRRNGCSATLGKLQRGFCPQ